jgi:hypothetical protein
LPIENQIKDNNDGDGDGDDDGGDGDGPVEEELDEECGHACVQCRDTGTSVDVRTAMLGWVASGP